MLVHPIRVVSTDRLPVHCIRLQRDVIIARRHRVARAHHRAHEVAASGKGRQFSSIATA